MKNKTLLSIFFIFLLSFATAWASSITLSSKTDNTNILATAANGDKHNVTLSDRTIFADGSWNTLTLPFSLTASQIAASPLADFTIKEMNTAKSGLDGEKLTLDFKDATSIVAGRPYIVKWQTNAKYDLLIRNKSDWDAFANRVNNGETFEGKVVMLASDFDNSTEPVTKMVGYYSWDETNKVATSKPFKGVFDGNGRTLTVNISSNEQYTAPFRSVIGATIKNLTVAGNIQVSNKLIGGMIAFAAGNNLISKCRVSATITSSVNGDGTVGGFVSNIQGGSTSIENSLFDGSFVGSNTTRWSGFVGWIESMATASHTGTAGLLSISYSLFSPASIDVKSNNGNSTFYRGRSGYTPTLTICYYTKSFADGNNQGRKQNLSYESDLVSKLGSTDWALVSNKPVPKMTTTPTSHDDIIDPTFQNVTINAKASTVATSTDGYVILKGTYAPFANVDGLLFDEHNTANGAFYAALGTTTRDGYTLSGWYTDEGKLTLVTSIPFASEGNATLYADFTIVTYTITYNGVKGASFETANPITYTVESGDILLNNPSKEGYEFVGWYNNAGFEGSAITGVAIASGSYGDKTFYAKWKKLLTHTNVSVAAIDDQTYTGSAICPDIVVNDGETPLEFGTDYTTSCTENTLTGTANMTITGMGNYAGSILKNFEITPKEITVAWGEQTSFIYNGKEQTPTATVQGLVNDDDCSITVSGAAKEVGTYMATATVVCNDNYKLPTENLEVQFEITQREISVSWDQTSLVYNGTEQAPTATAEGLVNDDDCSITVSGAAKEVGTYTASATVMCNDNYKLPIENFEVQFEIFAGINLASLTSDHVVQDGYVLGGTLDGSKQPYKISIADGATVTLKGVTINGVHDARYKWAGITCEGDCNIILAGTNVVKGFYENYPGIYVPEGKTLTISGTGSLDASGNGYGAGIGGGYEISCGNIVINGGTITATGGNLAAGIGGGYRGNAGNILISGGSVNATGNNHAPGIGGGYCGNVGKITITDGVTKVTAIKGNYALYSIGKGAFDSRTGKITIGGIETSDIDMDTFKYPYLMLVYEDGNGKHAVLNGEYSGDESVNITEDIKNVAVTFNRTFKQSGFATIVLPFDYDANDLEGVKSIIEFTGMRRKANGDTTVGMSYVWCNKDVQDSLEELATAAKKKCLEENGENCEDLGKFEHCNEQDYYANAGKMVAYTPYMVQMGTANISFKSDVTLKKTITPEARVGDWVFRGTLESHVWTDDETKDGKIWAFAGKVQQSAKYVGQFVKLGGGASATALKAYMICEPKQQNPVQQVRKYVYNAYPTSSSGDRVFAPVSRLAAANPPALAGVETSSLESLDVVIVSRDQNKSEERTTIIGSKGKRTGEIRMNRNRGMFDLKGRRVNESKKAKGVYYKR